MKKKVLLWVGVFFISSLLVTGAVFAEPAGTSESTPNIPVQIATPPTEGSNLPSSLPQDITQVVPPTSSNTSLNPNVVSPPPVSSPQVTPQVPTQGGITPPTGGIPATPTDMAGAMAGASAAEPVLNNYTSKWWLSPWFLSLLVLLLVIGLLVAYSLLEGKMPKEEKEAETLQNGKKKKAKK